MKLFLLIFALVFQLSSGQNPFRHFNESEGCDSQSLPNVVFIMADDLGSHDLGCYGQEYIQTPNIDRLATEGIRFTDFYAGAAVCAPSRSVLQTGMHTGHTTG